MATESTVAFPARLPGAAADDRRRAHCRCGCRHRFDRCGYGRRGSIMTFHPAIDYRELHRSKRELPFDDGKPFVYTSENRERLEAIAKRYPENAVGRRSAILPALYLV